MSAFFQNVHIGKMEEETQHSEEVVDPEQPESESTEETPIPDAPEHEEEPHKEETPDDPQPESENESESSSEITDAKEDSHPDETPETDSVEEIVELPEMVEAAETEKETVEQTESDTDDSPTDQEVFEEHSAVEEEEVASVEETPDETEEKETEVIQEEPETSEEENVPEVEETPDSNQPQIQFTLGESEELYDFIAKFEDSECSGSEHISVNMADSSGGVLKPAILEHPPATDSSRIVYHLDLPKVNENESLCLYFTIGLRDGVVFDEPQRQPGGVKFSIEISGEQCFESVSTECRWTQNCVNLTGFADKKVELVFITRCNVEGNSNFAWGLWGEPKLLKLTRVEDREKPSPIQCGLAIAKLPEERTALIEFNRDGFTPAQEIAEEIYSQLETEPIELVLYAAQPKLEIISVGATAAVVSTGEAYEIQCTIKNVGPGPLPRDSKTRLNIHNIKLRRGRTSQYIKTLAPGESSTYIWYARGVSRPTVIDFSVNLRSRFIEGTSKMSGVVHIRPALPKLESQVIPELHTYTHDESVVLGNKHLRLVFVHAGDPSKSKDRQSSKNVQDISETGIEYYAVFVAKGSSYQQIATSKMIAEITHISDGTIHHHIFSPKNIQISGNSLGESIVSLTDEHTDSDGVKWSLQVQLILTEDSKRIKTSYQLSVDEQRELLAFRGVELYAGHKSSREKKTAALFPGLEFLEGDEPSSSTRDAAPPINNRLAPHPYKITVPILAVEIHKSLVGIVWNPLQSWDGEKQNLSAVFASPNSVHHERNHLIGVFLPTIPEWVKENTLIAENVYGMTPDRPIEIECEIIADNNATILDAVPHWTSAYGIPKQLDPPRDDKEQILLSRHGFMHAVWDEEKRESRHCVDWASHNEPGFATLLWYDYLITKEDSVKERVKEIAEKTIADSGAGGLASRGSCHILSGEFPFYYGHLDAALGYYEAEVQSIIESQADNGTWGFQPNSEKRQTLGKTGDVVLGTCAANTLKLLKHARITGNKVSLEAGKKALSYMDRFMVPRGAQGWECPLYEPDILAAAHALGAYVEAHAVTGNKTYLKRAEYWANAGLPFLYHWHLPDRPGMQYASIPVFGTTFYTHSWFGVPVQWNGLVYAYYLQQLNQHTEDDKWRQIAEGITISAMYQQWTDGELKGTYPDGYYGFCTEGKGPHLNPEDIMVNVYSLRGLDPGIKTKISGSIHLSSGATPIDVTNSRSGMLKWTLSYAENETSHTLISGYGQSPTLIRAQIAETDGEKDSSSFDIPQVESLEDVTSGWRYIAEKDAILVKQLHITAEMQFQLLKDVE